jgi:hypothetical protein
MEYKMHECRSEICDYFEIHKVLERIKFMTYYQVYNAAKEAYVFSFSYIRNGSVGRVNRNQKRFINKALPSTIDHSSDTQGIPQCWTQAPPISLAYEKTKISEHQDISRIFKFPTVHGVRGVNNAPPSGQIRENSNVHKFVQRENQIESIAV